MRRQAKVLTLTAALLVVGCGSDENGFSYGTFPLPTNSPGVVSSVAVADAFSTLGNSVLTGSVTANDTVNGATVTAFQNPSNSGGTVAITAGGQLTYTPPANVSNATDTFTYTLSNSVGSSTATVTVTIGARGFFVKNDAPAGGSGTQTSPFNTLAGAVAAATGVNGAAIVVFRGDGTSTGLNTPATLSANQSLRGQDPANPPLLTGPITLTSGNTLSDLSCSGSVPAVINATNASAGNISAVNITTSGNKAVFLGNSTGTWTIQNSRFANANLGALDATCSTGTLTWTVQNCTFTNCFGSVVGNLTTGGTAIQTLTVTNNTFNNGRAQEVGLTGLTTGTNVTLTMTNNTVNGGGTALRGLDILSANTCNVTASVKNNVINGCTGDAILVNAVGASTCAARINNNTITGNNLGGLSDSLTAGNNNSASLRLALDGNTANSYLLRGGAAVQTFVENLATLTTRNTGTFNSLNLADGPCPAP
ncbi:hypothetical protein JST97_36810 [bacterium]|nr:hypothetical protein [bacterium]